MHISPFPLPNSHSPTCYKQLTLPNYTTVKIRLTPLPNAPSLAQKTFKISVNNRFSTVITFLRKKLRLPREEGVFCYVNSVFAPGLDESVGGLWDCFKTGLKGDEALVVGYSMTPAFG
ncbi:Ubiquitin-like protein [Agyrium rufum]|nr:Ubiquitin-like protein [Agyrium rufum]